jgi:hypothetical protein
MKFLQITGELTTPMAYEDTCSHPCRWMLLATGNCAAEGTREPFFPHHRNWNFRGGIEALKTVVLGLLRDFPVAFLAVVHLPAQVPSMLAPILSNIGTLLPHDAVDGARIQRRATDCDDRGRVIRALLQELLASKPEPTELNL